MAYILLGSSGPMGTVWQQAASYWEGRVCQSRTASARGRLNIAADIDETFIDFDRIGFDVIGLAA